eukprot:355017-Chlamydomonas_euryale.AAC.1
MRRGCVAGGMSLCRLHAPSPRAFAIGKKCRRLSGSMRSRTTRPFTPQRSSSHERPSSSTSTCSGAHSGRPALASTPDGSALQAQAYGQEGHGLEVHVAG